MVQAMVYAEESIVLFRGYVSVVWNGETWEWNGAQWVQRQNMDAQPRSNHSMAYDSDRKCVVMYGGLGNPGTLGRYLGA
jgi:hypothetical protein